MITALASGAFLGLSCGLAPGPLLALVVAQTLRHGPREGCKIALTPLVTDAPIIVVALVVAAGLAITPSVNRGSASAILSSSLWGACLCRDTAGMTSIYESPYR
jgi:threonine/homoserine/homoserine lactone efflux protein